MISSALITYAGRFQPFGPHHFQAWWHCRQKFGEVFIITSNKVEYPNSPFSFVEKQMIMEQMFNINPCWIWEVAAPYNVDHFMDEFDKTQRPFITCLSSKDAERLAHGKNKYFHEYTDTTVLKPASEAGYYYIMPEFKHEGNEINASMIRRGMAFEHFKKKFFRKVYGDLNDTIFEMMKQRMSFMQLVREEYVNPTSKPKKPKPAGLRHLAEDEDNK